jgi:hypothetical protein
MQVPGTIERVLMKADLTKKKNLEASLPKPLEYINADYSDEEYLVVYEDDTEEKFSKKLYTLEKYTPDDKAVVVQTPEEANLITSQIVGQPGMHALVIDLDVPHAYVPSTTPGHGHLYLDVPMTTELAMSLLEFLADCGVVEEGYYKASKNRGCSAVRPPWVQKENNE